MCLAIPKLVFLSKNIPCEVVHFNSDIAQRDTTAINAKIHKKLRSNITSLLTNLLQCVNTVENSLQ
uniref:Uncharacterized protein n=1 Tax=Arundo donax TaxID=35708 RepID=A0A0A9B673_ARUDO